MNPRAKAFIWSVLAAGALVLGASAADWRLATEPRFLIFLALTLVAATLKVKLPRVEGTNSVSFIFLVTAAAQFQFFPCAVLAGAAALVQSLWRPRRKPMPIQVMFNVAVLIVSAAAARALAMQAIGAVGVNSPVALTALATVVFYAVNSLLIATVVCLVEGRPLASVWQQCNLWSFPYYFSGAVLLAIASTINRPTRWDGPAVVLPLMIFGHLCYRTIAQRAEEPNRTAAAAGD